MTKSPLAMSSSVGGDGDTGLQGTTQIAERCAEEVHGDHHAGIVAVRNGHCTTVPLHAAGTGYTCTVTRIQLQ